MASITATTISANGLEVEPTINTLTASDTLTYKGVSSRQLVEIANDTAGSLDILFKGDSVAEFSVPGYGEVDPSSGKTVTVAAGESQSFMLSGIDKYLTTGADAVEVSGGTDATIVLYNIS